jgi:hypothetical protein
MARLKAVETDPVDPVETSTSTPISATVSTPARPRIRKAIVVYRDVDDNECNLDEGARSVTFDCFGEGFISFPLLDLPSDLSDTAMLRGITERLRDSYSNATSPAEAFAALQEQAARLREGEWASPDEGGTRTSLFLQAIQIVREAHSLPFDLEAARAKYVISKSDGKVAAVAKRKARQAAMSNPEVAAAILRLQTEAVARASAGREMASADDL